VYAIKPSFGRIAEIARPNAFALSSRFRGIEPAPIGLDYNFVKWYVPQGQQKFVMNR
jgi:peptide/nickel transport system substrate-binding protein